MAVHKWVNAHTIDAVLGDRVPHRPDARLINDHAAGKGPGHHQLGVAPAIDEQAAQLVRLNEIVLGDGLHAPRQLLQRVLQIDVPAPPLRYRRAAVEQVTPNDHRDQLDQRQA